MMLDLIFIFSLGFLGSFGHCIGMCGPLTVAFALPRVADQVPSRWQQIRFHLLLNSGRILSYTLVGMGIGAVGSVLIAGGQVVGVGSVLRRAIAYLTGSLLIWLGLLQVAPGLLPRLPLFNPMAQGNLHDRLGRAMIQISLHRHWWTPLLLGMAWGLIPCGFLYIAQLKAAETGDLVKGTLTLLAFGLGTLPMMLGVGISASLATANQTLGNRRQQLFRLGGWITLIIGILTLLRTGDIMVDYSGHAGLICLMLALIARPLSRIWSGLMHYRRGLGLGAFLFSVIHLLHMLDHSWHWNWGAIDFLLPQHRWGVELGIVALVLLTPAALTSFDQAQKLLGKQWRSLHLLTLPALGCAALHTLLVGSHYLGRLQMTGTNRGAIGILIVTVISVFLVRCPSAWRGLGVEKWYSPPPR
jgi:sulfite exporter TauE/SafE